jgi:hypothetical protein
LDTAAGRPEVSDVRRLSAHHGLRATPPAEPLGTHAPVELLLCIVASRGSKDRPSRLGTADAAAAAAAAAAVEEEEEDDGFIAAGDGLT